MGIAYTQQKQIYSLVRADTSAHLRGDLDNILGQVGWTNKVSVSSGFKYSIQSPQGLFCKVLIQDQGVTTGPFRCPTLTVQLMSEDETKLGMEHHLQYSAYAHYQIVAGYCQFFISLPVSTSPTTGFFGYAVAGGIPRLPDGTLIDCTAETPAATSMIFWSCSSGEAAFGPALDFRNSLWCQTYFSYCLNGVVYLSPGSGEGPQTGTLQIYTLTPTYNIDISGAPPTYQYGTHVPLDIDAFVGWTFAIRGQLWDAFHRTANVITVDNTYSTVELDTSGGPYTVNWIAWSQALLLRITDPSSSDDSGWNYAY